MEQPDLSQRFADNHNSIFSSDGLSFYRDIINHRLYFIFAGGEDDLDLLNELGYRNRIYGVIVLSSVDSIPMRAFEDYPSLETVEFQHPPPRFEQSKKLLLRVAIFLTRLIYLLLNV